MIYANLIAVILQYNLKHIFEYIFQIYKISTIKIFLKYQNIN